MALNAVIVDDEPLARRGLEIRLKDNPRISLIGQARNGREAISLIRQRRPDLVFLDVQMPGMNGFNVLNELSANELPLVIFVTAFDEYAVRAFEANALDYLLKPIDDERLQEAINRAWEAFEQRNMKHQRQAMERMLNDWHGDSAERPPTRLAIRDGSTTVWVNQGDIECIEAAGDYMCVYAGNETYVTRTTMKTLEEKLDPAILQRIHRSAIINLHRVKSMRPHLNGEYFITLTSGRTVRLSRSYKDKIALVERCAAG
ncbi:MAG: LytTR family DNA-binding domain-containing protein [Wenzhouxiangellaceae bacterium]